MGNQMPDFNFKNLYLFLTLLNLRAQILIFGILFLILVLSLSLFNIKNLSEVRSLFDFEKIFGFYLTYLLHNFLLIIIVYLLLNGVSQERMIIQKLFPNVFSHVVSLTVCPAFINEWGSFIESAIIGSNFIVVFETEYKLFNFVYFKSNIYDTILNKDYFIYFVQLLKN